MIISPTYFGDSFIFSSPNVKHSLGDVTDMLHLPLRSKCIHLSNSKSSRIDDQRCSPPEAGPHAPTVPDEDFFSLIQRVQAKRMDEQRVQLPSEDQDNPDSPDPEPPGGFSS